MPSVGVDREPVHPRIKPSRRVRLAALSLISLLFFLWLGQEVHTSRTQRLDDQIRDWVHSQASNTRTQLMLRATQLGSTTVVTGVAVLAALVFVLLRWWRPAILMGTNMGGALLMNGFLKDFFHRPRPDPFFGLLPPHSYSFPSGHSLFSVCCYGMIAAVVTSRPRTRPARITVWVVAGLIIGLVGLSRAYLGVHYPSDVLGGFAIGLAWISAILILDEPKPPTVADRK